MVELKEFLKEVRHIPPTDQEELANVNGLIRSMELIDRPVVIEADTIKILELDEGCQPATRPFRDEHIQGQLEGLIIGKFAGISIHEKLTLAPNYIGVRTQPNILVEDFEVGTIHYAVPLDKKNVPYVDDILYEAKDDHTATRLLEELSINRPDLFSIAAIFYATHTQNHYSVARYNAIVRSNLRPAEIFSSTTAATMIFYDGELFMSDIITVPTEPTTAAYVTEKKGSLKLTFCTASLDDDNLLVDKRTYIDGTLIGYTTR